MSLKNKFIKNSKVKKTTALLDSDIYQTTLKIPTNVYALNIALSGSLFGGVTLGELITFSAESKHFKTLFGLIIVRAFLEYYKDEDAVCLFYDSEGGAAEKYFKSMGIDEDRVIRTPIKNIEQFTFDVMNQLNIVEEKTDKVIIFVDSIGNLASKKEWEDALAENSAADMTRPKKLKALGRMVTAELVDKKVPCVMINHVYDSIGLFTKKIMGGGQGLMLSSNSVFFITKAQEKDGSELAGYTFTLVAEKSRSIKEKSRIPITVRFDSGVDIYTGLLDIGLATGHIVKPSNGWYSRVIEGVQEEKKWRAKDTSTEEFWNPLLEDKTFDQEIGKLYLLPENDMFSKPPNEMNDEEIIENLD